MDIDDNPHSGSTLPLAPEVLAESPAGVSESDVDRITHLNAMEHFQYDPFRFWVPDSFAQTRPRPGSRPRPRRVA